MLLKEDIVKNDCSAESLPFTEIQLTGPVVRRIMELLCRSHLLARAAELTDVVSDFLHHEQLVWSVTCYITNS